MLAGRADGSANGTGSANLAIGEIASPGLFKIFASNPSNAKSVLDEFIVAKDSPIQSIADLKGKRSVLDPASRMPRWPVLERAGATGATVVELAISQHVAAVAAGQLDACYTLEPTGTVGRLNSTTRVLEAGVIAKYVLGDPMAPWFGGSASLTTAFLKKHPEESRKFIAAYARGIELIRNQPDEARPYMKGYTAIEGPMTEAVPLPPPRSTTSSAPAISNTSRSSSTCSPTRASSPRRSTWPRCCTRAEPWTRSLRAARAQAAGARHAAIAAPVSRAREPGPPRACCR